jgi:hypothetical protein
MLCDLLGIQTKCALVTPITIVQVLTQLPQPSHWGSLLLDLKLADLQQKLKEQTIQACMLRLKCS